MKDERRQHPRRCPRFSGPPETSPSFRAEVALRDCARPTAVDRRHRPRIAVTSDGFPPGQASQGCARRRLPCFFRRRWRASAICCRSTGLTCELPTTRTTSSARTTRRPIATNTISTISQVKHERSLAATASQRPGDRRFFPHEMKVIRQRRHRARPRFCGLRETLPSFRTEGRERRAYSGGGVGRRRGAAAWGAGVGRRRGAAKAPAWDPAWQARRARPAAH